MCVHHTHLGPIVMASGHHRSGFFLVDERGCIGVGGWLVARHTYQTSKRRLVHTLIALHKGKANGVGIHELTDKPITKSAISVVYTRVIGRSIYV